MRKERPMQTFALKQLLTATILAGLLASGSDVLAIVQRSDRERDERIRDFFGERQNLRRDQGRDRGRDRGQPTIRSPRRLRQFRTIDGTANNLVGVNWGSAGSILNRSVPSAYADGVAAPAGANRESARAISNYICDQIESIPNDRNLSSMVWQWGQFLDHDIDLTETAEPLEPFPILVPTGDAYFDPFGAGGQTISLFRSAYQLNLPADQPREQINFITSWVDGSNVYGSDETTATSLRTLEGGLMKTSAGDLLPLDEEGFFLAGDIRANEQVCLTAMHTIFVREHNRIALQIATRRPSLTDEQIYLRARKQVTGIIQAITYNEFIPALMGEDALRPYRRYNPTISPDISNVFSTAAYRFGHSMLNTDIWRMDNNGQPVAEGHLALRDAFFNPSNLIDFGVDPYLKGLTLQQAQEIDTKIVTDLRNFLFGGPGSGGFDLAALNIQRGRDHGLADFNSIREAFRLPAYRSFDEITSDPEVQIALSEAYESVDEIDPWVGILAEDHVPGASVGETLFIVLKQQFEMLRDGDRFWYEIDFRGSLLDSIRNTTLAQVISRNSGVSNMQPNVFFAPTLQ